MKLSLALSFFAVVQVQVLVSAQEPPFDDCSIETYYQNMPANVTQWTRTMVAELIQSTHRNVPVYTNPNFPGTNDIWQALTDLDVGAEDDTVHLVYSNIDIPAIPFGTRSWVKEHLWANSRGIGNSGPDYRDIHAMRPVDSDVVFVRDELWYGECDILEKDGACSSPAEGAAEDTCQCNRVFMPPADSRGIIARSLMYMDLRYDGTEEDTLDLRLTDCPFNADTDMGYLSQMMTWSDEYSVTAAETTRNTMACTDWQGNRNPFVDFPQLAEILYPPANPLPEAGRLIYEICEDIPTSAPTFDPNDCETINPGELYIFFMNSDNPDNLSIFVFVDLPEDLELYVTDDAWNGLDFQTQEGAYKFVVPKDGISGGSIIGFGPELEGAVGSNDWVEVRNNFELSTEGEQIFLYCIAASGDPRPLNALSYNGPFQAPGLQNYAFNESALPASLRDVGSVVLPHQDNYNYAGVTNVENDVLRASLEDPVNWIGSDKTRYTLLINAGDGATRNMGAYSRWTMFAGMAIGVMAAML